jgi:hypothetical protein
MQRRVPSGKTVYYYYAYDGDGNRRGPWSTGQTSGTAARNYCNRLLKAGLIIPNNGAKLTFEEYAVDWWDWEKCKYLKKRRKRRNITQSYADDNKKRMNNQLVPYFGSMPMSKITSEEIENWMDKLAEEDYQNTYINGLLGTLKTMMFEAVARKVIRGEPRRGESNFL